MYFSTQQVESARIREAWESALDSHCGPFTMEFGSSRFQSVIDARNVGRFVCARVAHTSPKAIRTQREIDRSGIDDYFVLMQISGRSRIEQANLTAEMAPGDITVIDSGLPSHLAFDRKSVQLCLHVPKTMPADMNLQWRPRLAAVLPKPSSLLVGPLIASAFEQRSGPEDLQSAAVSRAILGLLSSSWTDELSRPDICERTRFSTLFRSIQDHVVGRLGEENLTPVSIAQAHGISERKLHRIFHQKGLSICQWIRQSRLDRCAAELRDPAQRDQTITEIAFRWGFNSAAHFSRVFREEFDQTPRDYRDSLQ